MSAELPAPDAETPPAQSQVVRSNRRQVLLFAALTLILTVATVWGGRTWVRNSETLIFAVGDANSLDARFAANRTIDHCQKRGWNLDVRNFSLKNRRHKPGEIANHAAAESNDKRLSIQALLQHLSADGAGLFERL